MSINLAFLTTKAMFNIGIRGKQKSVTFYSFTFYSFCDLERKVQGVFWADLEAPLAQIIQEGLDICPYLQKSREEYLDSTLLAGADARQLLTEPECAKLFSLVAADFPHHSAELESLFQSLVTCFAEWKSNLKTGA